METRRVDTVKLEERQKILLEIIGKFSGAFEHPTSALLHEYVLLCQLKGGKKLSGFKSYDFHAYMRGPYSEELRNDLEVLYKLNLIEIRNGRLIVTEHGEELLRKNRKSKSYETIVETCSEVLRDFSTAPAISKGIFDSLKNVSLGKSIH